MTDCQCQDAIGEEESAKYIRTYKYGPNLDMIKMILKIRIKFAHTRQSSALRFPKAIPFFNII